MGFGSVQHSVLGFEPPNIYSGIVILELPGEPEWDIIGYSWAYFSYKLPYFELNTCYLPRPQRIKWHRHFSISFKCFNCAISSLPWCFLIRQTQSITDSWTAFIVSWGFCLKKFFVELREKKKFQFPFSHWKFFLCVESVLLNYRPQIKFFLPFQVTWFIL